MRPPRSAAAAAIAVLCAFTIAAGFTVSRLLPGRLALWQLPRISAGRLTGADQVLGRATGAASHGAGATTAGVARAVGPVVSSPVFGPQLGVLVTDLATGRVLYARNPAAGFAPASTNKLATAIAALQVLGPSARFRTTVVASPGRSSIVLVGGGDPTLAAGPPPASDYPSRPLSPSWPGRRRPRCEHAADAASGSVMTSRCTPAPGSRRAGRTAMSRPETCP